MLEQVEALDIWQYWSAWPVGAKSPYNVQEVSIHCTCASNLGPTRHARQVLPAVFLGVITLYGVQLAVWGVKHFIWCSYSHIASTLDFSTNFGSQRDKFTPNQLIIKVERS